MAKIIVTSRYLKSGSKGNLSNYVKYIATRPGSVSNSSNREIKPVTDNQKQFIEKLLKDFPEGKEMFEYDDYISKPSEITASKLIGEIIERNSDRIANRKNYVGYLGKRPGVVKLGDHGLFSQEDKPIDLKAVAKEISAHKGNVWTHVVALRRDNAEKTGYTDLNSWRELVKRNIPKIAEASKIDMKNLKWYAAFHDKETNPHVHIIVYSTDPCEGFLTNKGIEKIRSTFANDIYHDELYNLYGRQTAQRDDLKKESAKLMHTLAENIRIGNNAANDLKNSIAMLSEQLSNCKGKLYYKYLPPDVKKTVDDIFSQLAGNDSIQKMYELWCEMEQQKHDIYSSAKVDFPPMTENKTFDSVKNMIIQIVSEMKLSENIIMNLEPPEPKEPFKLSDLVNNQQGLYKYGKALLLGDDVAPSSELGENLLLKAVANGNVNAKRYLALEYISGEHIEQDIDKGISMLMELADNGDLVSAYRLGKIYFDGEIVNKDYDKAEHYLRQAADNDNEYAMFALAKLYLSGEKKDLAQAVEWLEKACEYDSVKPYAAYTYAKILLDDSEFHYSAKAVRILQEAAPYNNHCSFLLGKLYLFGNDDIDCSKEEAIKWLTKAAENGNQDAEKLIQRTNNESQMLLNSIFGLLVNLSRMIEDNYSKTQKGVKIEIDKKLRRVILQKKEDLGIIPE